MLYFANPCASGPVIKAMVAGELGYIATPDQGNVRPAGVIWCADNGCYGKGWPGEDAWLQWLGRNRHDAGRCWFATAPDVVGDAQATLDRSLPTMPLIRAMGYPVALVGQDGLEDLTIPWAGLDVLFLGGSTDWKLGPAARALTTEAVARGKRVHMGRVNSYRRFTYAKRIGCSSVDGTFIRFGPSVNLPQVLAWCQDRSPAEVGVFRVRTDR
jgi:hypothetical protein